MPGESTDKEWRKGEFGFLRDSGNEQKTTLSAGQVFTGAWKRVDQFPGFSFLYGSNQPFTMRIEFSKDGLTRDFTASISPQVRGPLLGFYSVMSMQPRGTYFRPYYRVVVTNGPNAQAFVVTNAILSDHFPGYDISVDGPIPVLGLGKLGINLIWGYGVYDPITKTYPKIPLLLDPEGKLQIANFPDGLDVTNLPSEFPLPAAQVMTLTPPPFPAGFNVNNFPAFPQIQSVVTAGGTFTNLTALGTTVVKTGPGVLERVIVNKISAATAVTLTIYNGINTLAPKIATIGIGATAPGSSGLIAPSGLEYFAAFTTGLTVNISAIGADVTLVWR